MSESQIEFIEPKGFTVNFPFTGSPMTVRTKADEIVILMSLTIRPRDNVMNVNFNVTTSGDGATMPSLDKDAATDFSRYWTTGIRHNDNDRGLTTAITNTPPNA